MDQFLCRVLICKKRRCLRGDELVTNIIPKGIIMNNIAFSQPLRLVSTEDSTVTSRWVVFCTIGHPVFKFSMNKLKDPR